MAEREQKVEISRVQYTERYKLEVYTELHPIIAGMIHNYNNVFYKLCISNVCKMAGVKIY